MSFVIPLYLFKSHPNGIVELMYYSVFNYLHVIVLFLRCLEFCLCADWSGNMDPIFSTVRSCLSHPYFSWALGKSLILVIGFGSVNSC